MGPTAEMEEREAGPWGVLVSGRVGLWEWRPERSERFVLLEGLTGGGGRAGLSCCRQLRI